MELSSEVYDFAKKLLNLNKEPTEEAKKTEFKPEDKRVLGGTDYKKFEHLSKQIEEEEMTKNPKTKEMLKMGCNNDLRRERELYEKPNEEKLEAARIFKAEADILLKEKKWQDAIDIYEKGLLQLFYTFGDREDEVNKEVDRLTLSMNSNISVCQMKLGFFEKAVSALDEVLRVDKSNAKGIYRTAHCYLQVDKLEEAGKFIQMGMEVDSEGFKGLKAQLDEKLKKQQKSSKAFFSKILNKA